MLRKEILESLGKNPEIDVLVIGAGINGIGVFRDLALQGLEVLIADRADFCSGTSSASSHMAHGGIRYLENGEFRLVREAVTERNRLIANAPHLVRPLPTVIPMYRLFSGIFNAPFKFLNLLDRPSERGALVIKVGLMLYDAFTSGRRVVPRHRFLGRRASLERFPDLSLDIAFTAAYYDGQLLSPERLSVEILLDGEGDGNRSFALNYAPVLGVDRVSGSVRLHDEAGGGDIVVRPKVIVNAAGPWVDHVNTGLGLATEYIGGTKGSHIVLDHPELRAAIGDNEFFFENADGRIVLILPWFDRVIIGTSDLPAEGADGAVCNEDEIDYFIGLTSRVFPGIKVTREHIVFTFSGVRPLTRSTAKLTGQISRDHSLREDGVAGTPVLSMVGGKWTTFRAFSEQTTDRVLALLGKTRAASTADLPIGGGKGFPATPAGEEEAVLELVHAQGLDFGRASELFARYGTRARSIAERVAASGDSRLVNKPDWSKREVEFLVLEEKAMRLDDLVLRRSTLAWLGHCSLALLEELGQIMGDCLGWTPPERRAEVDRVADLLRKNHRAKL